MQSPLRLCRVLIVGLLVVGGCYEGDGIFIDRGWGTTMDRYQVNFGSIDLTREGTYTYHFSGLPHERFEVGIYVPHATYRTLRLSKETGPRIRGRLSDDRNHEILLDEQTFGSLGESGGPSVGWFLFMNPRHFLASTQTRYTLTVQVLDGNPELRLPEAKLMIKGGGWKRPAPKT